MSKDAILVVALGAFVLWMLYPFAGLTVTVVAALGGLGLLGALYAFAGSFPGASQWLNWTMKALLATGAALYIGKLTVGLPGAFVAAALLNEDALPSDAWWPLAIIVTRVGAVAILPASLALRLVMPNIVGWAHAGATALISLLAMCITTFLAAAGYV